MKIKSILFLFGIVFFGACDDFLERPPLAQATEGNFPSSSADAVLATNGVYNMMRSWNLHSGGFPILDIMTDQATKGTNPGDGSSTAPFENFSFDAFDGAFQRWYVEMYEGIRRANLAINEVPKITMDTVLQGRLIAESRFLRGYFYSVLVRGFGRVPIVLDVNPELDLLQSASDEIWDDLVILDLEHAARHLPERSEYDNEDMGRITKGTAKGLLARIALFRGDFESTKKWTEEVIASGQYDLEPDFSDVFTSENEAGLESVWEIPALPFNFGEGGNQYANTLAVRGEPNRGWGFGRPAYSWITTMLNNEDPRLESSVIFLGEELDGTTIVGDGPTPDTTYNDQNVIIEIECYNQKVWHPGELAEESFGHNKRMIRFADILLMAAEANNELGNASLALEYLERVRARARSGNAAILPEVTTTDQAALRLAIEEERNFELAFEGLRYWDLVRTGRAKDILTPLGFVDGKHQLMPIPQSEIDITEKRMTQNPLYE
ncbi:MAG: hypothetical protein ACI865_003333 [Flavobacteriaceae bacterium]|jgi:hypothetical protein